MGRGLNASRTRTFAPPLRSSSRFPCRPRTAFGTPAACRNRPRLRAGCPFLGRCFVLKHRDERHAERRDEDSSE